MDNNLDFANNGYTLFVGDLHAMPSNMEDTGLILDLVAKTAEENPSVHRIIFLGDIFHTHSVVRQETAYFVRDKMLEIFQRTARQPFLMAGNHDGSSPHSVEKNAVRLVFDGIPSVHVVDDTEKGMVDGPYFMVPFIGDNEKFVQTCQQNADKILVCHQTVEGAYYENKSLAPGGVDQRRLPQRRIISGHIHMEQRVGNVYYPGTPRALLPTEYNENKGIFVYDNQNDQWMKYSTNGLVKSFIRYDIEEGKEHLPVDESKWNPKDDVRICVHGSEEFYRETLALYGHLTERVKFIPDIRKDIRKKIDIEAEGGSVNKSLHQYVHKVYDADDQTKAKIWTKLQTLIPNLGNANS